ncbi:MAG: flagellar hook-associated protein FlgK, partial [Bdellovibrionales bacterium RIFOXYC2_FULL_39_8]
MSDLLGIGKTGLFTSKKSMETTGHNISNVNTEGYSRQRANQTTERSIVQSGLVKGTGSRIVSVGRIHDDFIEKRLNKELNSTEFLKERSGKLEQIESIFNEVDTEGLNTLLNKFFNSFKELSGQPENETMKMVVRDNAKIVIRDFQRIQTTLTNTRKSIDQNFKTKIADANSLINNIAHLNKEIVRIEQLGGESGDLRDGRDKSIRELSKIFEIHTYVDNRNNFAVAAKGVGTLVVAGEKTDLVAGPATKDIATNGIDGSFEIFYKDRPGFPITNRFQGGQITSLIKVRNEDIQN